MLLVVVVFNMHLNLALNFTSKGQTFLAGCVQNFGCRENSLNLILIARAAVIMQGQSDASLHIYNLCGCGTSNKRNVPFSLTDITSYYHPATGLTNHRPEGGPVWVWNPNGRIAWALLTIGSLGIGQWRLHGGGTLDSSIGRQNAFLISIKYWIASVPLEPRYELDNQHFVLSRLVPAHHW